MVLNLSPPWQGCLQSWSQPGPVDTTTTAWDVAVIADESLPAPSRPLFEAESTFQGSTCTLALPGFWGIVDPEQQRAYLRAHPAATLSDIHYFLRVVMALALFRQGDLLVHAAGVVTDAGALLFVGQSGAGKSTITSLAGERLVLHDDLVYLRRLHDHGWMVHTLPGETGASGGSCPLSGLLLMAQASHNYLTPVRPAIALGELVANSPVINAAPTYLSQLFSFWRSLLTTIPLQRLHFRPDHSFWEVLDADFG